MAAKQSTYARLLKPGQSFYVKGDYKTYIVTRVETATTKDETEVVMEGRVYAPQVEVTLVKVFIKGRSNALIFDSNDRVQLV